MLDNKGFDEWSGDYDESIESSSQGYPFQGYYNVLSYVHNLVEINKQVKILDLGIGTGLLTAELYKKGGEIYGIDFSNKMIELAKKKIPDGKFYCCDFKDGLPDELEDEKFDYIVSSYAFHHINDKEKISFIEELIGKLNKYGKIIIADISFETKDKMKECIEITGEFWDYDEFYMVVEDIKPKINKLNLSIKYNQVSCCAGVFEMDLVE